MHHLELIYIPCQIVTAGNYIESILSDLSLIKLAIEELTTKFESIEAGISIPNGSSTAIINLVAVIVGAGIAAFVSFLISRHNSKAQKKIEDEKYIRESAKQSSQLIYNHWCDYNNSYTEFESALRINDDKILHYISKLKNEHRKFIGIYTNTNTFTNNINNYIDTQYVHYNFLHNLAASTFLKVNECPNSGEISESVTLGLKNCLAQINLDMENTSKIIAKAPWESYLKEFPESENCLICFLENKLFALIKKGEDKDISQFAMILHKLKSEVLLFDTNNELAKLNISMGNLFTSTKNP